MHARIGDVRDHSGLHATLNAFQPDIVYHAAAYKHVPVMEDQPLEAWRTNVVGTKDLQCAQESGAYTFVLVSTDKASTQPVSWAHQSAWPARVRSIGEGGHMKCVITRFGNVLGNGSVIPLFRTD